jgi:hypothetical protein
VIATLRFTARFSSHIGQAPELAARPASPFEELSTDRAPRRRVFGCGLSFVMLPLEGSIRSGPAGFSADSSPLALSLRSVVGVPVGNVDGSVSSGQHQQTCALAGGDADGFAGTG